MADVTITGPAGKLEARYQPAPAPKAPAVLVLHPHPQHGGTMHNKVVHALAQAFARRGFATLRFNFRGVEKSEGSYGEGTGELADAAAALDWLRGQNPDASALWIAGFSFGAWIALRLVAQRRPAGFVVLAPPTRMLDFSEIDSIATPGLIVQGDQDQIVPPDGVVDFAARLKQASPAAIELRLIPGADHFFSGQLDAMAAIVDAYLAGVGGA
ncbi:MAG TPA: alpha/beta fold hydrolase [Stellaceae bacterium]|jgi:alpha/beta superfamily hydrolase|nr:alpha/beta fold hydrolase [Stellaceae bacterium]